MLIDVQQLKGSILASYVDSNNGISIKKFNVFETNGYGYYDYIICDDKDPDKEPVLKHFKDNKSIKKIPTSKFDYDELREFLVSSIPEEDKNELFEMRSPTMYAVDIEINIGDGEIFPDPHKAEFEIDSIQITSPNLNTVTLTTNKRVLKDDAQILKIENDLNDHYKDIDYVWTLTDRIKYSHLIFEDEKSMLEYWWKAVNIKLHYVTFWNGDGFDVPYLSNRSIKNGIDLGMGSPTGEKQKFINRNKDKSITTYYWPAHRLVTDYMQIVDTNAMDIDKQSLSLDYIANKTLGIGKIEYSGSFGDLYNGDIVRLMTYGAVDTVTMMLIHLNRNYSAGLESLAFYCRCPLSKITKTTEQVHSVIWDELYAKNLINAEPYDRKHKDPFEGGYVKEPNRKFVMYPCGVDFSALYPRIIQSHNMSFENFKGKVKNKYHAKELLREGKYVSVNGNYYDNNEEFCLKRVETKLLDERYAYKKYKLDIYLGPLAAIEKELASREA